MTYIQKLVRRAALRIYLTFPLYNVLDEVISLQTYFVMLFLKLLYSPINSKRMIDHLFFFLFQGPFMVDVDNVVCCSCVDVIAILDVNMLFIYIITPY